MSGCVALTNSRSPILHHLSTPFFFSWSHASRTNKLMTSAPLLPNILPHFQALLNFVLNTLPKPVLIALLYRLSMLHLTSRILPTIGADSWESDEGVHDGWDDRPVST